MSLEDLRKALDTLDEPAFCEGTHPLHERATIELPDGSIAAIHDPGFVDWIVEHGEPAPFGKGRETRVDPKVRHAIRLVARGSATRMESRSTRSTGVAQRIGRRCGGSRCSATSTTRCSRSNRVHA